jgi:hypothetical protein
MGSTSNIKILERFQLKALRMIVDTPWYVPNTVIQRALQIPTVKEQIRRYRGVLLSTLLHAIVYVSAQFAECTSTDCK